MSDALPTYLQIVYNWKVKPTACKVALVLRDFAEEQMDDAEDAPKAKVTIAVNKLASIVNATEGAINTALDELQSKGFVESNRPKPEDRKNSTQQKTRKPYYYRLRPGDTKFHKPKFHKRKYHK
jgi:hypothetical protein